MDNMIVQITVDSENSVSKLVEELGKVITNATEDSFFIQALVQNIEASADTATMLQLQLNKFLTDNFYLQRVCDIQAAENMFVLALRCADVHEALGFM